jgi:hypothetical protein
MMLGNLLERIFILTGIKRLVKFIYKGKDCGCDKRKEQLNNLFRK